MFKAFQTKLQQVKSNQSELPPTISSQANIQQPREGQIKRAYSTLLQKRLWQEKEFQLDVKKSKVIANSEEKHTKKFLELKSNSHNLAVKRTASILFQSRINIQKSSDIKPQGIFKEIQHNNCNLKASYFDLKHKTLPSALTSVISRIPNDKEYIVVDRDRNTPFMDLDEITAREESDSVSVIETEKENGGLRLASWLHKFMQEQNPINQFIPDLSAQREKGLNQPKDKQILQTIVHQEDKIINQPNPNPHHKALEIEKGYSQDDITFQNKALKKQISVLLNHISLANSPSNDKVSSQDEHVQKQLNALKVERDISQDDLTSKANAQENSHVPITNQTDNSLVSITQSLEKEHNSSQQDNLADVEDLEREIVHIHLFIPEAKVKLEEFKHCQQDSVTVVTTEKELQPIEHCTLLPDVEIESKIDGLPVVTVFAEKKATEGKSHCKVSKPSQESDIPIANELEKQQDIKPSSHQLKSITPPEFSVSPWKGDFSSLLEVVVEISDISKSNQLNDKERQELEMLLRKSKNKKKEENNNEEETEEQIMIRENRLIANDIWNRIHVIKKSLEENYVNIRNLGVEFVEPNQTKVASLISERERLKRRVEMMEDILRKKFSVSRI